MTDCNNTYAAALSLCSGERAVAHGRALHCAVYKKGLGFSITAVNSLIKMYAKSGHLSDAMKSFSNSLPYPPYAFSLTTLISSFSSTPHHLHIASLFHPFLLKLGLISDLFLLTATVNLYSLSPDLLSGRRLLLLSLPRAAPPWAALLRGYAAQGLHHEAIDLFLHLRSLNITPEGRLFASVFAPITSLTHLRLGVQLHSLVLRLGFYSHIIVANSVLAFYSKCPGVGHDCSRSAFHDMAEHDVVSWNSIIYGSVLSADYGEAVGLFRRMLSGPVVPNRSTYSTLLTVCGSLPSFGWGRETHCLVVRHVICDDVVVGSALVDMYSKCGRLGHAREVFDRLGSKNVISWNAVIVGYARHGFGREALELYEVMVRGGGVRPDHVTFLGVLMACGCIGDVEQGWRHLSSMVADYGIELGNDHLACMVGLLGRRGHVRAALELVRGARSKPDKAVWACLLSACRSRKDFAVARLAAEKIRELDPEDVSTHVTLSNMYAEAGMWGETMRVRREMNEKGVKKETGYSWIESRNKVYCFASSGQDVGCGGDELDHVVRGLFSNLADDGDIRTPE